MKILLIKPSCTVYKSDPTLPSATLPYGIAYLASYLLSKGEDVKVIDALSEGINCIKKETNKTKREEIQKNRLSTDSNIFGNLALLKNISISFYIKRWFLSEKVNTTPENQ